MVELNRFIDCIEHSLGRNIKSNKEQHSIITADFEKCLKVVAGPGSGKTTVVVLRLLKMIYVDGVDPSEIMATTFTKKAASELKSRILKWAHSLRDEFNKDGEISKEELLRINRLNFDAITTGTLDSIAENALTDFREVNQNPPVLIEEFITKQFIIQEYFALGTDKQKILKQEIDDNKFGDPRGMNLTKISNLLFDIHLRMMENGIDAASAADKTPVISELLCNYRKKLADNDLSDFATMEQLFLDFINSSSSNAFIENLKVLMVDEYQDTNVLQERIYLAIGKKLIDKKGTMMVVGDDDQALYRFRGSRVHLFTELEKRALTKGINFDIEFLSINYRSTSNIVKFCNDFVSLDSYYQKARVEGKPDMAVARSNADNHPIFGIFRNTPEELARDIVSIVSEYVSKGSFTFIDNTGSSYTIENPDNGIAGDSVLLCSSSANINSSNNARLPLYIRREFENNGAGIKVFNPRGSNLCDVYQVQLLCGTLLHCLDPDGGVEKEVHLTKDVQETINRWRNISVAFIQTATEGNYKLQDFVNAWANGKAYPSSNKWGKKDNISVLEIINKIILWIPEMRNDAEGLVYLQAITNTINKAVLINNREIHIKFDLTTHKPDPRNIKKLYNNVIVPIANGTIDINEELLFSVAVQDRFNIMTIHQSKGLEFPITFVDVSSDFKSKHWTQEMKRYPSKPDNTSLCEDYLVNYSPEIKTDRDHIDSQFDDLIRKYFVAFSRSQDVLILVGLIPNLDSKKPIPNIAMGWDRNENWKWKDRWNGTGDIKIMR